MRITAEGERLVVREGGQRFEADSGQALLDFEVAPLGRAVAPLARRAAERARALSLELTAAEWYALGCELEAGSEAHQAQTASSYKSSPSVVRTVSRRKVWSSRSG